MTSDEVRKALTSVASMTDADLQEVIRTVKAILLERKQARASKRYLEKEEK